MNFINYLVTVKSVFASKERFREYDSTAGVVMFIGELFALLGDMEEIDGITINIGREAVSIEREYMQIISKIMICIS